MRFVVKVFKCETVHEKLIIYRFFNCFKFEISFLLKLIKIKKKKFICNNETSFLGSVHSWGAAPLIEFKTFFPNNSQAF